MKKIIFLLAFFCIAGSFQLFAGGETGKLREENRRLRQELDRLRKEIADRDRETLLFRRWIAGVSDSGRVETASVRENRLAAILGEMIGKSSRLAIEASAINRTVRDLLKEFPIGPARQARILLQLEQLERTAMSTISITGEAENENIQLADREIRVIAVNRELETAVLSAGAIHGVFPGLLLQEKRNKKILLRIISVRPRVSAAVPVSENADRITPGMTFTAAQDVTPGSGIQPFHTR